MYRDSQGRIHCLLVYDDESGDGLLINSEGSSYARYSQYIPCAKMIVDSYLHQQTESIAESPQMQTHESFDLTFYSTIRVIKFSDEYEHKEELDDYEKMQCFSEMKSFTERYCNEDSQRGIMIYYDEDKSMYDKVKSAFVSLEIVDGEAMGVLNCTQLLICIFNYSFANGAYVIYCFIIWISGSVSYRIKSKSFHIRKIAVFQKSLDIFGRYI